MGSTEIKIYSECKRRMKYTPFRNIRNIGFGVSKPNKGYKKKEPPLKQVIAKFQQKELKSDWDKKPQVVSECKYRNHNKRGLSIGTRHRRNTRKHALLVS